MELVIGNLYENIKSLKSYRLVAVDGDRITLVPAGRPVETFREKFEELFIENPFQDEKS